MENDYIIGVDGGGTKTAVALADMNGKIIARAVTGISNPRNVGIEAAAKSIAEGIYGVLKRRRNVKVASTFIGLPAIEEEFKNRENEIITEIKKNKKIAVIFKGKIQIGSDQIVAFRSGAHGKDGIVAIDGTGCAVHGWNGGTQAKVNGWGWLADEGSAFWIGQKTFQAILKSFDGRVPDTILEKMALKDLKLKNLDKLVKFVYSDFAKNIPLLFKVCDEAASSGDKVAREILIQAGKEVALSVREVAAKLHFFEQVPLVLVGGAYNSRWVADTAMNEIERYYPKRFDFVVVADPVIGAVKLAIENVKAKSAK
jgi:N-acetylglucosamine kinase-like BadF-type ATPase